MASLKLSWYPLSRSASTKGCSKASSHVRRGAGDCSSSFGQLLSIPQKELIKEHEVCEGIAAWSLGGRWTHLWLVGGECQLLLCLLSFPAVVPSVRGNGVE